MEVKYCYISIRKLCANEFCVEGKKADGESLFAFYTMQTLPQIWREQARRRVPSGYIPVFQANVPARLLSA
jgi:hypothetical protein